MPFKSPDNIYWLFSTSAQAVAAFVGLIAAGFFFVHDKLDKQIEKDETLEDAYTEIKNQYYNKLKTIFILTGVTLVFSFLVIYFNGFDFKCINLAILIISSILTLVNIYLAIEFVLYIIDPKKVEKAVKKLIEKNENVFDQETKESVTRGEFLNRYIELETLIREIAKEFQFDYSFDNKFKKFIPLTEIFKNMFQREYIDSQTLRDLYDLNKIRNLSAHGQIDKIETSKYELLNLIISQIEDKFPGFS